MNVPVYRTTVSSTTKSMPRMSEVVTPQLLDMAIVANSIKHLIGKPEEPVEDDDL